MKYGIRLAVAALCTSAWLAEGANLKALQRAEKAALVLTGQPLPDELRSKFLRDEVDLEGGR